MTLNSWDLFPAFTPTHATQLCLPVVIHFLTLCWSRPLIGEGGSTEMNATESGQQTAGYALVSHKVIDKKVVTLWEADSSFRIPTSYVVAL